MIDPKTTRRGILKALGLGAAVVPAVASGEPELLKVPEPVKTPEFVKPFGRFADPLPALTQFVDGELISDWLYSGVSFPKNKMPDQIHFFCDSLGSTMADGRAADLSVTNMFRANSLVVPSYFAVERLGLLFSPEVEPRLFASVAERYWLEFHVGQKVFFRAPVSSLFDVGEITVKLGRGYRGAPVFPSALRGFMPLDVPVLLEPEACFQVVACGSSLRPCGKLRLTAYLYGRHLRPVQ